MGRFRQMAENDGGESGIDISPLLDCVFILLIFFIVTTTFVEETGVEVEKPQVADSSKLEKNSIMFAITDKEQVVYGGKEISIARVHSIVKRILQKEDVPVIVQADANVKTGLTTRVIGEATRAGAKVSIATKNVKG